MYVAESGIENGRPLVFLHGWAAHGGYFVPQTVAFGARHRILLPDLPGHRHSPAASADLTIPHLADQLHAMFGTHDLHGAVLVGWSMGAMVAFDYIARYGSAMLAGLVIEDMTPRILNDRDWQFGIRNSFDMVQSEAAMQMMRADWESYAHNALPHLFARDSRIDPALVKWVGEEMARNDGQTMAALWNSMAQQDYRWLMPQLELPVLILHGNESQLYDSAVSQWLGANIAGARRKCLDAAGHSPHLEMPDLYNACLAEFLACL
ncbi:alpha/beta fold hydrolase [Ferrovibrio sp.]|uniref:alpha/beta fold hydrolase n=1 Tax=Ferrovibrio sp. TaxID=1917215 RepID=UPI003919EBA0